MTSLKTLQQDWEKFAQLDPLWSICADPRKREGRWQEEDFFESGRREIATVLQRLKAIGHFPVTEGPALDFGCGVGRLTRALAEYFTECWGVDIAPTMIEKARAYHQQEPRCRFQLNEGDLSAFPDQYFSFIYSSIVLQHIDTKYVRRYLAEFGRVLKPGGLLVFQMADVLQGGPWFRLRSKIALRTRIRWLLSGKGPGIERRMAMHCVPEKRVRGMLAGNLRVVDVRLTNSTEPAFNGDLRYLDQEPHEGIVSKQYTVIRSA
ncbi:MAG: class I SAM-dependent methyltransferase [Acidobacteriia bacterium]|nr:class I SAM-dependent methyltransferase [Terriglobia bacterium]